MPGKTEQEKARLDIIEDHKAMFRDLVESSRAGMYILQDDRFVYANPKMAEIFGYTRDEIISSIGLYDLVLSERRRDVEEIIRKRLTGEISGVFHHVKARRKDGSTIDVEIHSSLFEYRGRRALAGTMFDVTERIMMEKALRESEERFKQLSDASFEGIAIHEKGKILLVNRAFAEIFGYRPEEVTGMNVLDFAAPHSRDVIVKNIISGYEKPYEAWGRKKDGTVFPGELCGREIIYLGHPARVTALRDIAEKHRMEEELLRMEKLESLGVLAGGIAHDFNNILTAILGNISIVKLLTEPQKTDVRNFLGEAERACMQAKTLTHQLLTFSKGGEPVKHVAALGGIVKEAAIFALRGSASSPEIDFPDDLWPVEVDPDLFSLVIHNMVLNADQAMPVGGIIKIKASNVPPAASSPIPLPEGRYVRISISDTGVGITVQYLNKIFDPFFTTKQKGSGLGLTNSFSIVKKHGGHITVESESGKGSTFFIFLPAAEPGPALKQDEPQTAAPGCQGRILVIDDNDAIRAVLAEMLKIAGYEVTAAKEGAEGISLYERALTSGAPYDLVILDLTIPGSMGGKEVVQKLRRKDPAVAAVVSSGYSNDPVMSRFEEFGFAGVVPKPYRYEQLMKAVGMAIGRKTRG